jgi:hypothetical protein
LAWPNAEIAQRLPGRKKGVPNIATRDLKEALRKHTPEMIKELVRLARKAEHEATRVAAIKKIFDRCYGKAMPGARRTPSARRHCRQRHHLGRLR